MICAGEENQDHEASIRAGHKCNMSVDESRQSSSDAGEGDESDSSEDDNDDIRDEDWMPEMVVHPGAGGGSASQPIVLDDSQVPGISDAGIGMVTFISAWQLNCESGAHSLSKASTLSLANDGT